MVGDEEEMKNILAFHGPVTAAVDASSWQDYLGGIIQYNCEKDVNHAVRTFTASPNSKFCSEFFICSIFIYFRWKWLDTMLKDLYLISFFEIHGGVIMA